MSLTGGLRIWDYLGKQMSIVVNSQTWAVFQLNVLKIIANLHCHLSEITELKYTSLIKIIIQEENFKWHLEAFASELFI